MVAKRGATPPAKRPRETEIENKGVSFAPAGVVGTAPRRVYDAAFKLHVVRHALSLPENNRHKPIARCYPGLTPVRRPSQTASKPGRDPLPAPTNLRVRGSAYFWIRILQ